MFKYTGRTVAVTGGVRGIGKGIAEAFSKAGAAVVIADIDEKGGIQTQEDIRKAGGKYVFVQTDVAEAEDCRSLFIKVAESFGRIDVLVNNAAIAGARAASINDESMENLDRVLGVNLRGVFMCAKFCAPHMEEGGAIVNIASTRAHMSEAYTEGYAASKAAYGR